MDPLSVAAGIAGLLSLSVQIVEIATKYGANSPKAQGLDIIFELRALTDVLKRLKEFLEGPDTPPTFSHVSTLLANNTRCRSKLQEILQRLEKVVQDTNILKRVFRRLRWPLAEKEHRETIAEIQRYTKVFHFALTVEGCALAAKSAAETAVALEEQIRKIEDIEKHCSAFPDLVAQSGESLAQISTIMSLIQSIPNNASELASISQGISQLKIAATNQERRYNEEYRKAMLEWLSPISFEKKQRKLFELHHRDTGGWFLQHDEFVQWRATKGSVLWCSGIPGAGKSVMASLVINALQESKDAPVGFIYADYNVRNLEP
jgi:hypothetical protein